MKNSKWLLIFGLSVGAIIGLSACGGKSSSHDTGDDGGGTQVATPIINRGDNGKGPTCKVGEKDGMIGTYNGYVVKTDSFGVLTYVPLQVNISSRQGSSGTGCPLAVSMTVGILGGVTVTTGDTGCDLSGNISATFANSSTGGNGTELLGKIECGKFTSAQITGKANYSNIVLDATEKDLFDERQIFNYTLNYTKNKTVIDKKTKKKVVVQVRDSRASVMGLSFTKRQTAVPSNQSTDLSLIPNLTTAISFSGFPNFPNIADVMVYDALMGHLEIGYLKYSTLKFDSVGLDSFTGDTQAPKLKGVLVGATDLENVELDPVPQLNMDPAPLYYRGTFKGPTGISSPMVGVFLYENKVGTNPADSLFPSFPQMQLQLSLCGGDANARQNMELQSINPLTSKAVFTTSANTVTTTTGNSSSANSTSAVGQTFEFDGTFGQNFKSLGGKLYNVVEGSPDNTYTINLTSTGSTTPVACRN